MTDIFDKKGMLIIPRPKTYVLPEQKEVLVIAHCYCPQGHDLVSTRAVFNGRPGIILKVIKGKHRGFIALSPIYGDKVRVALDIDLQSGELLKLVCPICNTALPVHSKCNRCGGDVIALFTLPGTNFADCVGICNRVDCPYASITDGGKLVADLHAEG